MQHSPESSSESCAHCAYDRSVEQKDAAFAELYKQGAPIREMLTKFLQRMGLSK